jgi:predicted transcriptional regulator
VSAKLHLDRSAVAHRPIADAVTTRGKELSRDDRVAEARRLLGNESVRVLPVLDGARYLGAVDRESIPHDASDDEPVWQFASALVPTAYADMRTGDALVQLDRSGASRMVVLADRLTYVGVVCLRGDRRRLCVDAECHAEEPEPVSEGTQP